MPKYAVEVSGEYTESVWGVYDIEAEDEAAARELAIEEFYGDNWDAEVVDTYVEEATD